MLVFILYFYSGAGLGNFWNGFLTSRIGRASGFQLMAFLSALVSLLYYAFYYCYLKKRETNRDERKCSLAAIPCNPLKLRKHTNEDKTSILPTAVKEEYV